MTQSFKLRTLGLGDGISSRIRDSGSSWLLRLCSDQMSYIIIIITIIIVIIVIVIFIVIVTIFFDTIIIIIIIVVMSTCTLNIVFKTTPPIIPV